MSVNLGQRERRASTASTESLPSSIDSLPSSTIVTVTGNAAINHANADAVVAKIEAVFEAMVDVLGEGGGYITIPYRNSRHAPERPTGSLRFPGRTMSEDRKFCQMMQIMYFSRQALISDRLITKRNIYYQNQDLFKEQVVVDRLIDDLACTLGVGRNDLNIVAASKGLIAGRLRLIMPDGTDISCASDNNNYSMTPIKNIAMVDFADTKWVLVIEKEATFRTLAVSQYWKKCPQGQGVLVTGKGYADLATLQFLHLIHTLRPDIPIFAVVDCDPHGIDIMRNYKHGSKALGHEANTRVPGLKWLGVKMDDIFLHSSLRSLPRLDLPDLNSQGADSQSSQSSRRTPMDSLMRLTPRDRKMAERLLVSVAGDDDDAERQPEDAEQMRELQTMLMLNAKAEIQAVDEMGDLSKWLDGKMETEMLM